jgi:hypothetical protein
LPGFVADYELKGRLAQSRGCEDDKDHKPDRGAVRHTERLAEERGRHGGEQAQHGRTGERRDGSLRERRPQFGGEPPALWPQP